MRARLERDRQRMLPTVRVAPITTIAASAMSGRAAHAKPYGRWQHRSRTETGSRDRAPRRGSLRRRARARPQRTASDTVGWRHPEHSLEIDFSRACTSWDRMRSEGRSTQHILPRGSPRRSATLRERRSFQRKLPDDLAMARATGKATAQQRRASRVGERKTNACELWRIMRDRGSGRAKVAQLVDKQGKNEAATPSSFALFSPRGQVSPAAKVSQASSQSRFVSPTTGTIVDWRCDRLA